MSLPVVFRRVASLEFEEAEEWYENRQTGRGVLFRQAIEETLCRIAEHPDRYATIYSDVREAVVRRYPFGVYYRVLTEHIEVVALFHLLRDPSLWQNRVQPES